MSSIYEWSTTELGNQNSDASINWTEEDPPTVGNPTGITNDNFRAMMGRVAEYLKDLNGSLVSTGSGNFYEVTLNSQPAVLDGLVTFYFRANHTNDGPSALTVNSFTFAFIVTVDGEPLSGGEIVTDRIVGVTYDLASGNFMLLNQQAIPDGAVRSTDFADEAVTEAKIADNAVTMDKFADSAVTSAKIPNGAVANAKLETMQPYLLKGALADERPDDIDIDALPEETSPAIDDLLLLKKPGSALEKVRVSTLAAEPAEVAIDHQSVVNQGTVSLTFDHTLYQSVYVLLKNVRPNNSGAQLRARIRSAGGSFDNGPSDYMWVAYLVQPGGGGFVSAMGQDDLIELMAANTRFDTWGCSGRVDLANPSTSTVESQIIAKLTFEQSNGNPPRLMRVGASHEKLTEVDGIQFFFDGGQGINGEFSLYGIVNG